VVPHTGLFDPTSAQKSFNVLTRICVARDVTVQGFRLAVRNADPDFGGFSAFNWIAIEEARARGEHPFHVVKRLWGFVKVRYRGLAKNLARAFSLFALANLYLVRRQLLPPQARYVL